MNKGLLLVAVLSSISFVIQLLPVISVPLTGKGNNYGIYFAKYNNFVFGVFGLCDYVNNRCSPPKIGYPLSTLLDSEFGAVELPSNARYSISKLLVVHVVAFAITGMLVLVAFTFIITIWVREKLYEKHIDKNEEDLDTNRSRGSYDDETSKTSKITRSVNLIPFLNFQLVFAILSCLFTLLGLLSDILLFSPYLSYLGWIQIIPIICLAVLVTMVCFMRRSIFSRRHLDEEYFYPNDDMKAHRNLEVSDPNDSGSDDGFYVYTNGFYSNYGDREHHNQSQQSNSNSWRRHTPFNGTEDEVSLNSSQFHGILNRERIQLSDLSRNTNVSQPSRPQSQS
ncbi:pH-response regulator protein palI/RIM9 [[Candida] jaroonii]|uniref:PH-response regulator protein palI/RIM9 n=1 Tax=[Candida] jaroonii TaxID=467808 RepID=A0ACA9Y9Q1_9ASCO|nr:pH-response regulator protein palI/RIM9 [[Candida] jaroonii]